ncbi:MAG: hypothetical protein ACFFD4_31680 [Candidatus Odinarchaeota archaeon]
MIPVTLKKGCIIHVIESKRGIKAFGILTENTIRIYVKPSQLTKDVFENEIIGCLTEVPGPVYLFQKPIPSRLAVLLDGLSTENRIIKQVVESLPVDILLESINRYPKGIARDIEVNLSVIRSLPSFVKLIQQIKHGLACKLLHLVFKTTRPRIISDSDTNNSLKLESDLPIDFEGTLVNVQSSGSKYEEPMLVTFSYISNNNSRVFFNENDNPEFIQQSKEHLNKLQRPFASYIRYFAESWLDTEVDYELRQVFIAKPVQFKNLIAENDIGTRKDFTKWWREYQTCQDTSRKKALEKRLVSYTFYNLLFDCIFLVLDSYDRWRVPRSDWYVFLDRNDEMVREDFNSTFNSGVETNKPRTFIKASKIINQKESASKLTK